MSGKLTSPIHVPLTLDEMIESLGSVLPAMKIPANMAVRADYYDQLTELLGNHGNEILYWLIELRRLKDKQ